MSKGFFEQPILNSPYLEPTRHHALSPEGRPLEQPPVLGRRRSELISPVPPAKKQSKRSKQAQADMFSAEEGEAQKYTLTVINEIREAVAA